MNPMATQPLSPAAPRTLADVLRASVRGWDRFWFHPADPTTLGLIRLCAGLVVLYVHLVYTLDLQDVIGPHAWIDLRGINQLRSEMPISIPPTTYNPEPPKALPRPGDEAEAQYVDRYTKTWGSDPRLV